MTETPAESSGDRFIRRAVRHSPRPLALLGAVLVTIVAVLLAVVVRQVDGVEIFAVALFVPILAGVLLGGARGGGITAAVATFFYGIVRSRDRDVLGDGPVARLVASRGAGFLVFGVLGGLAYRVACQQLAQASEVDHDSGLSSAPALGNLFDLEVARARRYARGLAVVRVTVVLPPGRSRHVRRRDLSADLGGALRDVVRTVDRIGVMWHRNQIELAAVLPETAASGAEHVAARIAERAEHVLNARSVSGAEIGWEVYSVPGAERDLEQWRASLTRTT